MKFLIKSHLLLFLFGALLTIGCKEVGKEFTYEGEESFSFKAEGGSGTLRFTTGEKWTASSSADWISVTTGAGLPKDDGPIALGYKVEPNESPEKRSGTITISSGGKSKLITINQYEKSFLVLEDQYVVIDEIEQVITIKLQSNTPYDITITGDWISQTNVKALTEEELSFSISANTEIGSRYGKITFEGKENNVSTTINIEQKGLPNMLLHQAYGVYDEMKEIYTHNDTETQYGMIESNEYLEFHIVNSIDRNYCLIKEIPEGIRSMQVGDLFEVSIETNNTSFDKYNYELSLKILKIEDSVVWAWDKANNMGIIIRTNRP